MEKAFDGDVRIKDHPIIKDYGKGGEVRFTYDGREVAGREGEPIAAALKALGVMTHRYTVKSHEPRGIFCAIGRCTDCVMVVDGTPNVRTCMTPLKEGMDVRTQDGLRALGAQPSARAKGGAER
jgi:predicted molibdopterin-dependent oxidoreductase YjgC